MIPTATSRTMLAKRWYRPLFDLVYPRICSLCSKPIVDSELESICSICQSQIKPTEFRCLRCSAPLPTSCETLVDAPKKCFYCERRKWSFRNAYCYTAYAGMAAIAARKIKQQNCESLAIELGRRVGCWLQNYEPFDSTVYDFVIPIPQHWFRRITVRYNQAEVLAENIARVLEIPIRRHWLHRTRWTNKQGTKTIVERRTSVIDSFGCKQSVDLKGAKLLLVDDIVTSGATSHDASRALRKAGVARIDVAAFARGVGGFNNRKATVSSEMQTESPP